MNSKVIQTLNENYKFLFRIANRMSNSVQDSEDILQDVYVKALTKEIRVEETKTLPWCITVVKNVSKDYLRKNKNTIPIDYRKEASEDAFSYIEWKMVIFNMIKDLHPKKQLYLILNLFENMNAKQISIYLNTDYEKTRHEIYYVKRKLKKCISL